MQMVSNNTYVLHVLVTPICYPYLCMYSVEYKCSNEGTACTSTTGLATCGHTNWCVDDTNKKICDTSSAACLCHCLTPMSSLTKVADAYPKNQAGQKVGKYCL